MYVTQILDAKREAHIFNRRCFHLPKEYLKIRIRHTHDAWALAYEKETGEHYTTLNISYPNYKFFRNILVHELVHQWQYFHGDTGIHNANFFSWHPKLKKYGITLKETY